MTVLWPNGSLSIPHVTSEFGPRDPIDTAGGTTGSFHYGIDLVGWSYIQAPAAGYVIFAGYNGGAGNEVRIRADNGDVYRLMHNRELWVVTGQYVAQKTIVGIMGTTGSSTGVHCHFETKPGGGASVNPRGYMAANSGGTAGGGTTPIQEDDMASPIEYIYAFANGSPSWCWLNWSSGVVWSAHTEKDAAWVAGYMQGYTGQAEIVTEEQYNSKVAFCQMLNPKTTATVDAAALSKAVSGVVIEALKPLLATSGSVITKAQVDEIVRGVVENGINEEGIGEIVQNELSKLVLKAGV